MKDDGDAARTRDGADRILSRWPAPLTGFVDEEAVSHHPVGGAVRVVSAGYAVEGNR